MTYTFSCEAKPNIKLKIKLNETTTEKKNNKNFTYENYCKN